MLRSRAGERTASVTSLVGHLLLRMRITVDLLVAALRKNSQSERAGGGATGCIFLNCFFFFFLNCTKR